MQRLNILSSVTMLSRPTVCHFLDTWHQDLQIYTVTPVSDISDVPQLERVPERIKSFYRINNVSRFHYDRPFHKVPKDRENEFRVWGASRAALCLLLSYSSVLVLFHFLTEMLRSEGALLKVLRLKFPYLLCTQENMLFWSEYRVLANKVTIARASLVEYIFFLI